VLEQMNAAGHKKKCPRLNGRWNWETVNLKS
jgi:hypothetical protein